MGKAVRLTVLSTALLVGMTRVASADPGGPLRTFAVEPAAEECAANANALATVLPIVCDASQVACHIGAPAGPSDRRLILDCRPADHWELVAYDAAGGKRWLVELDGSDQERIRSGAQATIKMETKDSPPARPVVPEALPATRSAPTSDASVAPDEPKAPATSDHRNLGIGLLIGGAAVGFPSFFLAVGFGMDAASKNQDIDFCSPRCRQSDVDAADRSANLRNVFIVTTLVALATGVTGLVFLATSPNRSSSRLPLELTAGVGPGGAQLQGRF